jgi:hypothetical protein
MARTFNGSTDGILTTSAFANSTGDATLFAWVYPTSLPNAYNAVYEHQPGGVANVLLFIKSSGFGAYYLNNNVVDPGSITINTNVWSTIGVSYGGSGVGLRPYVNGVADTTAAFNGAIGTASGKASIGYDFVTTGRQFNGRIALVAEWNSTLTAGEHLALAEGALPSTIRPKNLTGFWPLDGLQSPEPDFSGNANNGTLTGTALAPGPPVMPFTPRCWQQFIPAAAPTFSPAWALNRNTVIEGVAT